MAKHSEEALEKLCLADFAYTYIQWRNAEFGKEQAMFWSYMVLLHGFPGYRTLLFVAWKKVENHEFFVAHIFL